MKIKNLILIATLAAAPLLVAGKAEANDRYCREYTKTVRIGGNVQAAYGTACMQPDGSWEMVSFDGHDDLFDDIAQDAYRGNGRVIYVDQQPANYWYPPMRPRHYYRPYYRPGSYFSFYWNDNDRHDRDRRHDNGRHNGWDKHDNRRGHGHDRHDHH